MIKHLKVEGIPVSNIPRIKNAEPVLLLLMLLLIWSFAPGYLRMIDNTAGSIDQSIWLLVLLSIITFLLLLGLCWWLMTRFLKLLALPRISSMVSQFHLLDLWQQFVFYWASFFLLLFGGMMCLMAIC